MLQFGKFCAMEGFNARKTHCLPNPDVAKTTPFGA